MDRINTRDRKDGHSEYRQGNVEGVIKIEEHGGLAKEFITAVRDFNGALGRCVLRDDLQRNAVIIYAGQLRLFPNHLSDEFDELTDWLSASASVGGFNRSLASMTECKIFTPDGAGIKMDKKTQQALFEMQKLRAEGQRREEEKGERREEL